MAANQDDAVIAAFAEALRRRGLVEPARMFLHASAPVDLVASQLALALQPFCPRGRWHTLLAALGDERAWEQLRQALDR